MFKTVQTVISRVIEAIHLAATQEAGLLRRFAPRNDVDTVSYSRRALRPRFAGKFLYPPIRGREEAGRPMRPIAACAMVEVERTRVSQVTPESPGIPRAMVLTVSSVLSPATGLS